MSEQHIRIFLQESLKIKYNFYKIMCYKNEQWQSSNVYTMLMYQNNVLCSNNLHVGVFFMRLEKNVIADLYSVIRERIGRQLLLNVLKGCRCSYEFLSFLFKTHSFKISKQTLILLPLSALFIICSQRTKQSFSIIHFS